MWRAFHFACSAFFLLTACSDGVTDSLDGGTGDAGTKPDKTVILDGGGDPATPPDGESKCPAGTCNFQSVEGCAAETPSCIPAVNGEAIVPACAPAGNGTSGVACSQTGQCAAGYVCVEKACHKLCCGGDWTGCPSPAEHCIKELQYSDGKGGALKTGAMLCYPVNTCNALSPWTCGGGGLACLIADATGATACLPEGTGDSGEACPCKGGMVCVIGGQGPTCRRLCRAEEGGGEPSCEAGEGVCIHFTRDPDGVGECTP